MAFPTKRVQELNENRLKELQAISMFHENMEQKLSEIHTMVKNSLGANSNASGIMLFNVLATSEK